MKMCHPDGTHISEVPQTAFDQVWSQRGWKPVADVTKTVRKPKTKKASSK